MKAIMHISAQLRGTVEARIEYDTDEPIMVVADRAEAAMAEALAADKNSRYLHDIKMLRVKA